MKINKIAILTSGGDSAGMNAAIKSIVDFSYINNIDPYVIYEGYKGLVAGNIKLVTKSEVEFIDKEGGTFIYSARFPEFKEEETRKTAIKQLEKHQIDALIVIGGDGSYIGAAKLSQLGFKTIALPGTIDNDIPTTDYTIGFFSTLHVIVEVIDQVKATANSHDRVIVIETMGRYCGDLAIYAAIATSVEVLSVSEQKLDKNDIFAKVIAKRKQGKRAIIVLVTEHLYDVEVLAKEIEENTKIETRSMVIGHLQRGAKPVSMDRLLAKRMGLFGMKELLLGKSGVAINIVNEKLNSQDILQVVETPKTKKLNLIKEYNEIS